jgi:acetyl/propionyl-CoA carboxylase alpha subunit/acetyl-CoA carboxylase carboxyltransferase component
VDLAGDSRTRSLKSVPTWWPLAGPTVPLLRHCAKRNEFLVVIGKVLVANRGEIAVRVLQSASVLGISTVGVATPDDLDSAHAVKCDELVGLEPDGGVPYLSRSKLLRVAIETGCDSVHPGYGFLSEDAEFARMVEDAGLIFIGPSPSQLEVFGSKTAARELASGLGIPIAPGTIGATSLEEAIAFTETQPAGATIMVKALMGGGGRGMMPVTDVNGLKAAYESCASEALKSFGNGELYVERLIERAKHIEVQIVGDGHGEVTHLWDRDCSVQRRRQKVIEFAPALHLDGAIREKLFDYAVALGRAVGYRSLGTVEFLVSGAGIAFLELNPRVQVEHTVTEEVTGLDLIATQFAIAQGSRLRELNLTQDAVPSPTGVAVELRLTGDVVRIDGSVKPSSGTVTRFDLPTGRGIRVDTHARAGIQMNPRYDSLLAKVIVVDPSGSIKSAAARASRALEETQVEGVDTNRDLLHAILKHPDFVEGNVETTFIETHIGQLLEAPAPRGLYWSSGKDEGPSERVGNYAVEPGHELIKATTSGVVVSLSTRVGDEITAGSPLFVLEAMKMEHLVTTPISGRVSNVLVEVGDVVEDGDALATVLLSDIEDGGPGTESTIDLDASRDDLERVLARHHRMSDEGRPSAVARRHAKGNRTARENIADLCDEGSFIEYGKLVVAAQHRRYSMDHLIDNTPADGLIGGLAAIHGRRIVVISYDYTVLAGTQGIFGHLKTNRLLSIAAERELPVVMFVEGGGGRPGDTDFGGYIGLDEATFALAARLSGKVPTISIVNGFCFAGNAALAGVSDVIIATKSSSIGMGGPAMIEGGGLGVHRPEDVGPIRTQVPNGVIDVLVEDEAAAVQSARDYLSYFNGASNADFKEADQRLLRHLIPESRLRVYDVGEVMTALSDVGSVYEIRPEYGRGIRTSLARIRGRAVGIVANNPLHLGGAIDSPSAEKAARFLRLCDAHGLPVVSLVDTPGFMVGPQTEATAAVRRFSRLFLAGAHLGVPLVSIILRKGYGLGAMAMTGGHLRVPIGVFAWPTAEFGAMGLEGSVRLGFRRELEQIADPEERQARYQELLDKLYEHGSAMSFASVFEIDDVIDPKETRSVIDRLLEVAAASGATRAFSGYVDSW